MRILLLSVLLASAAASPAIAQDSGQPQKDRKQAHEERQQAREQARTERSNGGAVSERAQQAQPQPQPPAPQVQQVQGDPRGGFDRSRFNRGDRAPQQVEAPQQTYDRAARGGRNGFAGAQPEQVQPPSQNGGWSRDRGSRNRQSGDLRQGDRAVPNVMRTRNPLVVSDTPREGTQPPLRTEQRRWSSSNWNTNWRNNNRYNWQNYRNRHRSTFHLGIYYDPFGYGYRSFDIGYRLQTNYFGQQYWIDPQMYELPFPPPGTQWVRYWNDALLVDMYSGEVVDVIHSFFW